MTNPDVGVLATRGGKRIAILMWHYHDDDVAGEAAEIRLVVSGIRGKTVSRTHYRIDERHSNSYAAWQRMGSPIAPDKSQYDALALAGELATVEPSAAEKLSGGKAELTFELPRQAVSLLLLDIL